jgi:hypothetical protein
MTQTKLDRLVFFFGVQYKKKKKGPPWISQKEYGRRYPKRQGARFN